MFVKTTLCHVFLSLLLGMELVAGRQRWLERNNRPVRLNPRRFGQENPAVIQKLQNACPGQVCGVLAGDAIKTLLAAQPECSQQDMADQIIDASRQFDADTQANMIAIAQEFRQVEKNTPPDFSANPPILRNSVFCGKAPKNSELDGLFQAQDPGNDPDVFFDPAENKSVKKGEQPNTFPFGQAPGNGTTTTSATVSAPTRAATGTAIRIPVSSPASGCPAIVTATVSGTNPAATSLTNAVTVTVGKPSQTSSPAPVATSSATPDFGSCPTPEVEFGAGFDNRKETSFEPVDRDAYPHGSAQGFDIIAQFMCDSLTNICKANQAAKDLCNTARSAAASAPPKTGAQADAFNEVFGIKTNFANIAPVDDKGNTLSVVGPTSAAGAGSSITSTTSISNNNGGSLTTAVTAPTTTSSSAPTTTAGGDGNAGNSGNIGNFGSCPTPAIEFGQGFDSRRETSFRPQDLTAFNHGSAQDINIIAQFICGQLKSPCKADQAALDECARATSAAENATPAGSGAQADAFNAVFRIQTNFADVQQIDDQGRPVGN